MYWILLAGRVYRLANDLIRVQFSVAAITQFLTLFVLCNDSFMDFNPIRLTWLYVQQGGQSALYLITEASVAVNACLIAGSIC